MPKRVTDEVPATVFHIERTELYLQMRILTVVLERAERCNNTLWMNCISNLRERKRNLRMKGYEAGEKLANHRHFDNAFYHSLMRDWRRSLGYGRPWERLKASKSYSRKVDIVAFPDLSPSKRDDIFLASSID